MARNIEAFVAHGHTWGAPWAPCCSSRQRQPASFLRDNYAIGSHTFAGWVGERGRTICLNNTNVYIDVTLEIWGIQFWCERWRLLEVGLDRESGKVELDVVTCIRNVVRA